MQDDNHQLPPVGDHLQLSAESGRGLQIVALLADDWGVERSDDGKAIWFTLHL